MRNYLKNINIMGCTMVYRERERCIITLDWLYDNCDQVLIVLDNWDKETENIVKEYQLRYSYTC